MRLDELPDDILTMVLERSLVCKYCSFCFKANLVLAAISRQVRRAALPLVYREIYYRCTRGVRINQRSYYADGSVRPPDTEIRSSTNASLVASVGCTGFVRRASFYIEARIHSIPQLLMAAIAFSEAGAEWATVQSLEFTITDIIGGNNPVSTMAPPTGDIDTIDRLLATAMPNVWTLLTSGQVYNPTIQPVLQRLVESRRDQLRVLRLGFPMVPQPEVRLTGLHTVHFDHPYYVRWTDPLIDPTTLVKLRITNLHAGYLWTSFGVDGNGQSIEFPALQHLRLKYRYQHDYRQPEPPEQVTHAVKLLFPRLQTARIYGVTQRCAFLDHAVFPTSVERLEIAMSTDLLEAFANIELPVARILVIHVDTYPYRSFGAASATRHLLLGAHRSKVAYLNVRSSGQIFSVDSIFGVGLTDLTVQRLISVDDMLALAGNLPRLERLSVRCDGCSTVQSDISLPKPSERSHPVHPLSTSIRWLYIDVRNERRRCSQRTALVKFILLKIPSLDLLDMTCADNAKLMRFNKSHKLWYPRLGTVKVESTKYFCGNGVGAAHMKAA